MNVLDIATDAYRMTGLIGETETPSAEQGSKSVTRLNDIMAEMAEDGIDVGWNAKSNSADTVVLAAGTVLAIKAILAVSLLGDYGLPIPPTVVLAAEQGRARLQRQAVLLQNTPVSMRHISGGAGQYNRVNIETGD